MDSGGILNESEWVPSKSESIQVEFWMDEVCMGYEYVPDEVHALSHESNMNY